MQILKIQLEARYTHILDFATRYKSIVSPYLKMSSFKIENYGVPEEYCVLSFNDEPVKVELRWDRAILIANASYVNIFEKNGPSLFFFDILNKLIDLDSFGSGINMIVAAWALNEKVSKDMYFDTYIKKKTNIDKFEFDDVFISEDHLSGEDFLNVQHGLFKPEKDLRKYGIADVDNKLKNKTGHFFQFILMRKTSTFSLDKFAELYNVINSTYSKSYEL